MQTFRAIVTIPKAQLKGSSNHGNYRNVNDQRKHDDMVAAAKRAEANCLTSEHDVRSALLNGTLTQLNLSFDKAWADMLAYQKYQKELEREGMFFRRKQAKDNPKRYSHTFQFSH